ncbi:hypothetical protein J2R99_000826 [Rhodopseudomonas julia]|uniref:Uncharacterized protein n=1 Tax=Rhodopseudomonas julia TaxID=200617 RepID=A0ABU0C411_9BRAD|nr:hypothetical protein [Rhodopseudomonas julia]
MSLVAASSSTFVHSAMLGRVLWSFSRIWRLKTCLAGAAVPAIS